MKFLGLFMTPSHARWIVACLTVGLLHGCSENAATDGAVAPTDLASDQAAEFDSAEGLEPVDTSAQDAAPELGSDTAETIADCPGGAGCPCKGNTDCQTGLCIDDAQVEGGKGCARKCQGDCPASYSCANVPSSGGDILSICVPQFAHLCEPCTASKDCEGLGLKDSACVAQGGLGSFCGVLCQADADCPSDFSCSEVATAEGGKLKQCVKKADSSQKPYGVCSCNSTAVQKKLATPCYVEVKDGQGQVTGKCAGQRTCTAAGLSNCAAPEAKTEVCNGADDDCDGQIDEASCDDGKPCTKDVCAGKDGCKYTDVDGDLCDADGSACTEGDSCKAGVCVAGSKKDCDDKNPCTQDSCELAKGCTQINDDGKPCDADGTACTSGDICQGGSCQKGALTTCDDSNPCTTDKCDAKTGACVASAEDDGIPCDDGTKCTSKDACSAGVCKGKAVDCDDSNPCTEDVCDKAKGCTPQALTGAPCTDDNPCTLGDTCDAGTCKAGKGKECASTKPCVAAECDLMDAGKCKFVNKKAGAACDDGDACTGSDGCLDGACEGSKVGCDDGNPCSTDSCDQAQGCVYTANLLACSDGDACTEGDQCAGKACAPGKTSKSCDDANACTDDACVKTQGCVNSANSLACSDGNACTEGDKCAAKACVPGPAPKVCTDANPCTDDSCDPKSGCSYAANTSPCDDGNACTQSDLCAGSACQGKPLNVSVDCADGNPCTTDACDPKAGCVHNANQLGCDDGNPCTQGDLCKDKACGPGSNVCGCQKDGDCAAQEDGDLCNGTLFCDTAKLPYTCKVKAVSVVVCDASKDTTCASSQCAAKTGQCGLVAAPDGKGCDADGSVCTTDDNCLAGLCKAGASVSCEDKNPCTADSCDPKAGCTNVATTAPCDADGDACTVADTCKDKVCLPGNKKLCDDKEICTVDSCDKATGNCSFDSKPEQGKDCDADGSVCTMKDSCAAGKCVAGAKKDCFDNNVCTDDSCDSTTGCVNAPNTATCVDGNACTEKEVCAAGDCQFKAVSCNDQNPCTDDSCDKVKGCVNLANSVTCSDGNACTAGDACAAGKCAGAGVKCDDMDPCTSDSCDPVKGCVAVALAEKADCSGDGQSWCVSGGCVLKGAPSCASILSANKAATDGVYAIDPDAAGPIAAANLFCDMKNGGWTLVGSYYDSAGDDMPNSTDHVVSGWQQTASGKWDAKAATVDRAWGGGTGSAAVSMAFVEALGKAAGQKNLKMCFVHQNGYDTTCRQSSDGSLTLVSYDTGNPKLTAYAADKLTYTFGRLAGLAGSVDGYDASKFGVGVYEVPVAAGKTDDGQFGGSGKLAEYSNNWDPNWNANEAIWSAAGGGVGYRPWHSDVSELGAVIAGETVAGFRLYIGPSQPSFASCKAVLTANPGAQDGVYPIDPDGPGPIATANLFCDMKNGGWTLVGNYYDSAGDDMPNSTDHVVSGWQQTASGKWDAKAATVDRAWGGGTGSAAVSMAFVEALGKAAGQKNLKMCFVHKDGQDTTCRQSSDGSLTLVSYDTGNSKLTAYKGDKLTYTFGRLAGIAGSVDGYANFQEAGYCIPMLAGVYGEWGSDGKLCEQNFGGNANYTAVWHAYGSGIGFMPNLTNDAELRLGGGKSDANPSPNSYGFRVYVGPELAVGTKASPGKSCKVILDAKSSLGDGSYWLDPDGAGPGAPVQTWCDMTRDGGGWTLVGLVHRANGNSVSEPHNWFVSGNNASLLAYQQEAVNSAPSAFAASTWQPLLAVGGQARFDLAAHLDPQLVKSWYKAAAWSGFSAWFQSDANPSQVCTDLAMTKNCTSGTIAFNGDVTNLAGMNLSHYGYQSGCELHMRLDGDGAAFYSAVCSCTINYNNNTWPDSGGDGQWGNGLRIWLRETICSDGQLSAGEQCDDGNSTPDDGCSATCQLEAFPNCKAILAKFPATPDGVYPIDPDGAGPIPAANLFCDMKNGGWTLVGNYYDSAGDDMPNSTDHVVSGWQQTASGKWDAKAATVDRAWGGGTGSAAVSMAFVEALGKAAGQKNLKMCFVHKDGQDTTCRQSSDGSLTLVSYDTGNPKLTAYKGDKLTYTFGRLAGLAGSVEGYSNMQESGYCMPVQGGGAAGEWGDANKLCEQNCCGVASYTGVWHAWGGGIEFMPPQVADDELRLGGGNSAANPSVNSFGFRLYIGP